MEQLPFWQRLSQHPAYDEYWQDQAVDRILGAKPLTVPTLLVDSEWDQEDIYGAPAVFDAVKAQRQRQRAPRARPVAPRPGEWRRRRRSARSTGARDTGKWFRAERDDPVPRPTSEGRPAGRHRARDRLRGRHQPVEAPRRLAAGLRARLPGEPDAALPRARPPASASTRPPARRLRLLRLRSGQARSPTAPRPNLSPWAHGSTWRYWLVDDQRFAEARPDVLTYASAPLTAAAAASPARRSSTSSPRPAAPTATGSSS